MDHLELYIQMECIQPVTLFPTQSLWGKAKIGMEWLATRKGLGATNHFESGGHIRSRAGIVYPDIQYHFLPLAISYDGQTPRLGPWLSGACRHQAVEEPGLGAAARCRPESLPRVRFNYMSHPDDWLEFRACIALPARSSRSRPSPPYRGRELAPGAEAQDDAALDDFLKRKLESAYHPCGTCRMGTDDARRHHAGRPGARRRRPARRRCLADAAGHGGRSQRADAGAGRTHGGPDPRPPPAGGRRAPPCSPIRTGQRANAARRSAATMPRPRRPGRRPAGQCARRALPEGA